MCCISHLRFCDSNIYRDSHPINVSTPSFMEEPTAQTTIEEPTAQTIVQYLHDLAYGFDWLKIKPEFSSAKYMEEEAYMVAGYELRGAYLWWHQDSNAEAALTHLLNASAICNERLTPEYLLKYKTVVSYFQGTISGSSTPVHQGAHMRNLLLRVNRPFGSVSELLFELTFFI
jgi:hypothetical protein